MPIGKDSIQKRVAKATDTAPAEVAAEVKEAPVAKPAAKKTAAKKPATAKKASAATAEKKPAAKTSAPKKPAAPKATKPEATIAEPATAVIANVSPEVVAAVVGHEEGAPTEHVSIGDKMPNYLL